jgi:hypothetical protein
MFRLLIADDQVPDSNLASEQEVLEHYSKRYKDSGFAAGFVFIYKLMKFLKAQNYEVDSANTPSKAIELVKSRTYDVIILDLGWWTIESMAYDDKMILGWRIAKDIQQNSPAQILMFSNRFYENQELANTTAEMGCLPVYKSYDDAGMKNLLVTTRWATLRKPLGQVISDETKAYSFRMYRRFSNVLLGAIISSVILLLVSVALAAANKTPANVITSVFGVVITFVNGAIYKYVSEYRKSSQ